MIDALRTRFLSAQPDGYFLDPADLGPYLRHRGWTRDQEKVTRVERAFEDHPDLALRVYTEHPTGGRWLLVWQARPWDERAPDQPLPVERILVEARYYKTLESNVQLGAWSPRLIGSDAESGILAAEDLGRSTYADLGPKTPLEVDAFAALLRYLSLLHRMPSPTWPILNNPAMRQHRHARTFAVADDHPLRSALLDLGDSYLSGADCLVHGDFQPKCWLRTSRGPKIFGARGAHLGRAEFDVGVFLAHLVARGQPLRARQVMSAIWGDPALVFGFAGAELLRVSTDDTQRELARRLITERTGAALGG